MTTSQDLLLATVIALRGPDADAPVPAFATDAGGEVFQPGDWPTQDDQYPRLKVRLVGEQKTSLGRGGINFTVVSSIRLIAEVSAPVQVDDIGATDAEQRLWSLARQIECVIVNAFAIGNLPLQQIPSFRTQLAFSSDGATHLAGAQIDIDMEFYQGLEDFEPATMPALERADLTDLAHPPIGASVILSQ